MNFYSEFYVLLCVKYDFFVFLDFVERTLCTKLHTISFGTRTTLYPSVETLALLIKKD